MSLVQEIDDDSGLCVFTDNRQTDVDMSYPAYLPTNDGIYCKRMYDALDCLGGEIDMSSKETRDKIRVHMDNIRSYLASRTSTFVTTHENEGYLSETRERILVEPCERTFGTHSRYGIKFTAVTKQARGYTYGYSFSITIYKPGLFLVIKQQRISIPHNGTDIELKLYDTTYETPIPSIMWHLYSPATPLSMLPQEEQNKLVNDIARAIKEYDKKHLDEQLSALMSSYSEQAKTLKAARESIAAGYRARFDEEARRISDRYGGHCDSGYFTKCQSCSYCSAMSNLYSANNGIPSPSPSRYLECDDMEERTYVKYLIDRARILKGDEGATKMKKSIDYMHSKKVLAKDEVPINFYVGCITQNGYNLI